MRFGLMDESWAKVLKKIGKSFLVVSTAILLAILSEPLITEQLAMNQEHIRWFRLFTLAIVAWGVLGRSGWEIQSFGGKTLHERFNSSWFYFLYLIGVYCGALGILVKPITS